MLNRSEIEARKAAIEQEWGPWSTIINLGHGIMTSDKVDKSEGTRRRRFTQIITDLAPAPMDQLRILDLACLEGAYSIECALRGAEVVGIEGREPNAARARFAGELLGLDRLTILHDDVRNLSLATHGRFDMVLCLGILYHLEAADAVRFIQNIYQVTKRVAIFDTHMSLPGQETHSTEINGETYAGHLVHEHKPDATRQQRIDNVWASLDNPQSFWFTFESLCRLLAHIGFTSVHESHLPSWSNMTADRITLVAYKGLPAEPMTR